MLKKFLLCVLLLSGCVSGFKNEYVEGTSLTLGLYIPFNGTVYGLQCVNYLSGKKISVCTNQQFKIDTCHSISNASFGVFEIIDNSTTKIQ